jgi:hypothetical protein
VKKSPRCLYENSIKGFLDDTEMAILGLLCENYNGVALTTQIEAWKSEIEIMHEIVSGLNNKNGRIR